MSRGGGGAFRGKEEGKGFGEISVIKNLFGSFVERSREHDAKTHHHVVCEFELRML